MLIWLVFVMFSHLFIAALWSPTGKGPTSWLLFVVFNCIFVTFPCGILGQVWYLIVSIPDLCGLFYFKCAAYTSQIKKITTKDLAKDTLECGDGQAGVFLCH